MEVKQEVEKEFGYVEMLVASHPDLYAGKLCAALDRQYPRDFLDVKTTIRKRRIDRRTAKDIFGLPDKPLPANGGIA